LKKSENISLLEKRVTIFTLFRVNFHFKEVKSHSKKVRFHFKKSENRHFFFKK